MKFEWVGQEYDDKMSNDPPKNEKEIYLLKLSLVYTNMVESNTGGSKHEQKCGQKCQTIPNQNWDLRLFRFF